MLDAEVMFEKSRNFVETMLLEARASSNTRDRAQHSLPPQSKLLVSRRKGTLGRLTTARIGGMNDVLTLGLKTREFKRRGRGASVKVDGRDLA